LPAVPAPDPGASRSLRARLRGGPVARAIGRLDLALYRRLRTGFRHDAFEPLVAGFSAAGSHGALWYGIGLVGLTTDPARRPLWRSAMLTVLVTELVNTALKTVVRRRRPAIEDLPALVKVPTSLSFPSAHASMSFAAARRYSHLVPTLKKPLYTAATAMAVSRVYLGVHFPSDIAVGAFLGTVIGKPR
jgi:undecaprenyl-diphosphatase